jgi:L-Ala-D/L-Glu epimerase
VKLHAFCEDFPLKQPFKIAYHTFDSARLIRVDVHEGRLVGRGEGGAHPQLEPLEEGLARIQSLAGAIEAGMSRLELLEQMPRGPARNALDCALWDLECKRAGKRLWELENLPPPRPVATAFTIGIASLHEMVAEARRLSDFRLLKLKLDSGSGFEVLRAIAEARPDAEFIIDANEGWRADQLHDFLGAAAGFPVRLIEQPLPKQEDELLRGVRSPIPLAADESFHGLPDVARLDGLYSVINIKLDKIGGLTEGLLAARAARERGMEVMVGCNNATSLGIAPAYCLALMCQHADLDSPPFLARDREPALAYRHGNVHRPDPLLWG